jgi:hypothetical protein
LDESARIHVDGGGRNRRGGMTEERSHTSEAGRSREKLKWERSQ